MKLRWYHRHIQLLLIALISIIVTFVYRFPDVYAYYTVPPGIVFLGQNSWFDAHDINVYVSVIHYAQRGYLLLPNLWTAQPNEAIFIFPIELVIGYILRISNPYLLFWSSSVACGVVLIVGMFRLIHKSDLSYLLTTATTLGIALGGGFGFLLFPNIPSSDMTSAITFYESFMKPHEAIAMVCYLYALVMFYEVIIRAKKADISKLIIMSLSLVVAMLIYSYFLITYLLITLLFLYKSNLKITGTQMSIIYIPALVAVLFDAWQLSLNQGFSDPLSQHLATTPLLTILGYGIIFPIFCYQLFFMKKTQFLSYLNWWVLVTLALACLPFGPGKIFLRGLFFPLVLIAVLQMQILLNRIVFTPVRISLWITFFAFLCATNVYIMFLRNQVAYSEPNNDINYLQQEDYKIFDYLNSHVPRNSGVLAGEKMSNLIPAYTYDRGCIGSMGSITSTFSSHLNAVTAFYAGRSVSKNYLKQNNIAYVLWGPSEQEITSKYFRGEVNDLSEIYEDLKLVYATGSSKLYQVK